MERDTATLEEDVCFEGCPDGCDKRQGTRGKVGYCGKNRGEKSGARKDNQELKEGVGDQYCMERSGRKWATKEKNFPYMKPSETASDFE